MAVYLGVDYGLQRIGVAISDPTGSVALPVCTLQLEEYGTRKQQLAALEKLARDYGAEALIFGLPLHEDGSESLMSRQVRNVAGRMNRRLGLSIFFEPEYLSSYEANRDLCATGLKRKKIKAHLDAQAASRILMSFLSEAGVRRTGI